MKRSWYLLLVFIVLVGVYFTEPFMLEIEVTAVFLTVSTFLFAIITGFFISRQNNRHETIRQHIAVFDGTMSALYRSFAVFGPETAQEAEKIIKQHYQTILSKQQWDYHITHRSTTITSLNQLLAKAADQAESSPYINEMINNIIRSLDGLQVARKQIVSLHIERLPFIEKMLVVVMAFILLFSLLLIPADALFLGPLMKGYFGTIIVTVVLILFQLDSLSLFESMPGRASATDIMNIIEGKR